MLEDFDIDKKLKERNIDKKIYEEKMNELIQRTIPNINFEEEYKEEMAKNLEEIFRNSYQDSVIYEIETPNIEVFEHKIKEIIKLWNNKSIDEKRRALVFDEGFEKIYSASMRAYKMAKDRVDNNVILTDEKQYNELMAILQQEDKVKDFNKYMVKQIISEGILDLMYAFGKSEAMSMRVGNYKAWK